MEKILLIDDDPEILESLTKFFGLKGYMILAASSGKTGIEYAQKYIPGLIICDALMLDMAGFEVLRRLKSMHNTAQIPFIISTYLAEHMDRKEALALGATDYIVKPFNQNSLLAIVKKWITPSDKKIAFTKPV